MFVKWLTLGTLVLILVSVAVQSAYIHEDHPFRRDIQHREEGRVFFPIEVNVPDVINGILSAFRFLWGRLQSLVGSTGSAEFVGAKDPPKKPKPPPLTPSPALQALPLAPEQVLKSPVQLVSVEVDDPVRHPSMHKTKIKRKNQRRRKKKREKIAPSLASEWELFAMEEGWI